MSAARPLWSPTDEATADLLTLVADDGTYSTEYEWELFIACLKGVGAGDGWTVNPNSLRTAINGRIKPQRVGAFTHRALSAGLVEYTGRYVISTDRRGKNGGKPCRELRWVGESA